jgi:hypothetical protein
MDQPHRRTTVLVLRASGTVLVLRASGTVLVLRASGTVSILRASGTGLNCAPPARVLSQHSLVAGGEDVL